MKVPFLPRKISVSDMKKKKSKRSFKSQYKKGQTLSEERHSGVKRVQVTSVKDHREYTARIISKTKISEPDVAILTNEISILETLDNTHIVNLREVIDEKKECYLVTDRVKEQTLFDRIIARDYHTEKEAKTICKQLLSAMVHYHQTQVVHCDIKPENIYFTGSKVDEDEIVKIGGFESAKRVSSDNRLVYVGGRSPYAAPECYHGVTFGTKADMWSLGVILYILLCGYPPFTKQNMKELVEQITRGEYEFHEKYWGDISTDAKDMVRGLLTVNPDKRLTATECLEMPWITGKLRVVKDDEIIGYTCGWSSAWCTNPNFNACAWMA